MNIHNAILPSRFSRIAIATSQFTNSRIVTKSGQEICSADNNIVRRIYLIEKCKLSLKEFEQFNNFFLARQGSRYGFLLKDYFDYSASNSLAAISDLKQGKFILQKTYLDSYAPYLRPIKYPIKETIKIYINGNVYNEFRINEKTRELELQFTQPESTLLPKITASFEFYTPVRFKHDDYKYYFAEDGSVILSNIEMQEVII